VLAYLHLFKHQRCLLGAYYGANKQEASKVNKQEIEGKIRRQAQPRLKGK
jgi:hypothetical protein